MKSAEANATTKIKRQTEQLVHVMGTPVRLHSSLLVYAIAKRDHRTKSRIKGAQLTNLAAPPTLSTNLEPTGRVVDDLPAILLQGGDVRTHRHDPVRLRLDGRQPAQDRGKK